MLAAVCLVLLAYCYLLVAACLLLRACCCVLVVACLLLRGCCCLLVVRFLRPGKAVDVNRDAMNELSRNPCRRSNPGMSHRAYRAAACRACSHERTLS
ncbi:hypothetical protein AL504_31480 [Achromobacter xylosoxidans]|uniref:Uncharacterized protein n=1 Tax=Alcaligenes xylosoxydans xylosoxydans TaxID=85698 RepID=A0A2L0PTL6_ALCXX|nr:hypothetical protein AL504_31480 [Achromobacter xylosoxidans]